MTELLKQLRINPLKNGFGFGGIFDRLPIHFDDVHERWMSLALLEGMNAVGWASPNPAVGCVIVHRNQLLAKGFTQEYRGKHAERMAFESLTQQTPLNALSDLTVYITLEPCSHTGNQPPCVDLLLHDSVKTVVIACEDPDLRVSGRGIQILKNAGKEVILNVLKDEASAWHFPFLKSKLTHKPLWVAKWAENQEGYLADADGNSKWITNAQSRAYTHWLRQKYDAILVGAGTWLKDQPQLTVRDCLPPHRRNPIILIHDPKKLLPGSTAPMDENRTIRLYSGLSTLQLVNAIEADDFGFELQSVFCEGGAYTINELMALGKIDLVHRFIGQKLFDRVNSSDRIHNFTDAKSLLEGWSHVASHKFGNDLLQEWLNCS